ncbi:MAG: 1-deoxy-D-xylulose-5-phosphate reductoisomerase, partial [Treponema sp.]|nr:1-deoxy-D-xylulose-5-phosphate reductoisomerase [Treponema sp.]
NKGLEVIEARRLFDTNVQNISVVVHPESLIHSLVRTSDGILYAQISEPDMRHPIMGALCWPEYVESGLEKFSLAGRSMSFYEPRRDDFPLLGLAESAADKGASYTIAFNAADEIAAHAFIDKKIGFLKIAETVQKTLAADWSAEPRDFDDVFEADKKARALAEAAL